MMLMITMIMMVIVMMPEFDTKNFRGDTSGLDDVDDDYYKHDNGDNNDDKFDGKKYHSEAVEITL